MTSISTDGHAGSRHARSRHAGSQAQSPILRRGSDQVFTLSFLITSAVATIGWFYVLAQGAVAVANWLFL
jgi:hypothetical protein